MKVSKSVLIYIWYTTSNYIAYIISSSNTRLFNKSKNPIINQANLFGWPTELSVPYIFWVYLVYIASRDALNFFIPLTPNQLININILLDILLVSRVQSTSPVIIKNPLLPSCNCSIRTCLGSEPLTYISFTLHRDVLFFSKVKEGFGKPLELFDFRITVNTFYNISFGITLNLLLSCKVFLTLTFSSKLLY